MEGMEDRKKKILQAIVLDYISTAEPIGSRTISRKYDLGVSSATIRNEMADLEDLGYIEQPHTSAGRIPSQMGYRYYVDFLMEKELLQESELHSIKKHFSHKADEISTILKHTSQLLSQLTNYTALITLPELKHGVLSTLQLVPISSNKVLLVIVTDTGYIDHKTFDLQESVSSEILNQMSYILTEKLRGQSLQVAKATVIREIYSELSQQKRALNEVLDVIEEILSSSEKETVLLGGTLNILNQPEYQDVSKAKDVLSMLENFSAVKDVLFETQHEGVTIRIGNEVRLQNINGLSVITATYNIDGEIVGAIGLLGPTRMSYSRASALIECISQNLSEVLSAYDIKR